MGFMVGSVEQTLIGGMIVLHPDCLLQGLLAERILVQRDTGGVSVTTSLSFFLWDSTFLPNLVWFGNIWF